MDNLQTFIGTKTVKAIPMNRGDYNAYRGWNPPEGEDQTSEGYLVEYTDGGKPNNEQHAGYISWSPKEQFDNAYQISGNMSFGHALVCMEKGMRVARSGWNGKDMWLCLGKGNLSLPADQFWGEHTRAHAERNGGTATVLPYIIMKTATGEILMGWLASQSDMLAHDWCVV